MAHLPLIRWLADLLAPWPPPWPAPAVPSSADAPPVSIDDVLSPYIYVFYAAFGLAFVFTPVMRQVALYYGVVDAPDRNRKLHTSPIAYLGGIAVFLGWIGGLATSQFTSVHRLGTGLTHLHVPVAVIGSAALIIGLGLWDDLVSVSPRAKIVVQLLAAGVLLWGGIGAHSAEPLLSPILLRTQVYLGWNPDRLHPLVVVVGCGLTVALVVACCNATNLMDGMDGLCGGVTALVAAGFTFLSVHMATYGEPATTNADGMRVVLGLALLGASLGFVLFNFSPASIFLGDTGSLFLGFSCATLIALMAENEPRWFLAAMIMFALPVLDTALAVVRRWVNRRPLFSADRQHLHHQILGWGYSVRQTVLIIYAVALGFVLLGAVIVFIRVRYAVAFYMVIFGSILVAAYKTGLVHERAAAVPRRSLADAHSTVDDAAGPPIDPVDADGVLEVVATTPTADPAAEA